MRKLFDLLACSCVWFLTSFPAGETGPVFSTPAYLWHGRGWGGRFTRVVHWLRAWNICPHFGTCYMTCDILTESSNSNNFQSCWKIVYCAEPIMYVSCWIRSCCFETGLNMARVHIKSLNLFFAPTGQAVLNRNLHSAAGQRKLSPEEEYARQDLSFLEILVVTVVVLDWAMLSYIELLVNSTSHSEYRLVMSSHLMVIWCHVVLV